MLGGLKKRGLTDKSIGTDWALDPAQLKTAAAVLPKARFKDIGADCLKMRIMVEEAKPGRACCDVAYKVHAHQIKNGMQDFIYHRPATARVRSRKATSPRSSAWATRP